jgi:hypothetical protein
MIQGNDHELINYEQQQQQQQQQINLYQTCKKMMKIKENG